MTQHHIIRHTRLDAAIEQIAARADRLEAERDALAAQVAALVEAVRFFRKDASPPPSWNQIAKIDWNALAHDHEAAISNLPSAAAKYLAAQRVCEILMTQYAPSLKHAGPLVEAIDEWRKAGE